MAKSGGPTIGLDIGSSYIKVAEAVPGRNGVTVRAMGVAPTPEGSMENNIIIDSQLLGQACVVSPCLVLPTRSSWPVFRITLLNKKIFSILQASLMLFLRWRNSFEQKWYLRIQCTDNKLF